MALRGWGRTLREGVADWYQSKTDEDLALQLIKYKQRDGWSHRDLLRLSHPKAETTLRNNLYKYVTKGPEALTKGDMVPRILVGAELAKTATAKETIKLIRDYDLPREALRTDHLNDPEIWEALLAKGMPLTAMIRNLGKMTSVGVIQASGGVNTSVVVEALTNDEAIKRARVHPLTILTALKIYNQGHGDKGSLVWRPSPKVVDALNDAFYASFGYVQPAGKNTLLALDISGSMGSAAIAGSPLTAREVTAAMAMVTARTEKNYEFMGFGSSFIKLNKITPASTLQQVMGYISGLNFGATDCSLPMTWARENKVEVDTFVVYTDNETYAGKVHPFQALKQYRDWSGRFAKEVVVGTTATNFTIADPSDPGSMDVVGFDTATPNLISAFSRGEF